MTRRVVIITEIIAPYRVPVFKALAQRKEIDLHVIFLSESDPSLRQWRVYKEEIDFQYQVLPSWRRRFGRYNLLLNSGMSAAMNRIRPDVIFCGGYNYLASWRAATWANSRRVPFLLWSESTAADSRRRHWPVELMKARFLRLCRGFVVPGRSSLDYLKGLGITEKQIFHAPNAVDTVMFSKLAGEARGRKSAVQARHNLPSRYFLFVGRLVEAKGVFELVEAYAQMHEEVRSQVGLVFVGEGDARIDLMKLSAKASPGKVQFLGFVHREQLPELYALADALIFPTHSDPWGLVVNEAMSCGLAVVATSVAGCVADLVQDGWNGFVVPREDPAQLAASMTHLAADSELRLRMGSNSWERVQAYSPEAWAGGLVEAVQFVCARAA
jgi:glycosyltransferase involved in cell wall biosynthesis